MYFIRSSYCILCLCTVMSGLSVANLALAQDMQEADAEADSEIDDEIDGETNSETSSEIDSEMDSEIDRLAQLSIDELLQIKVSVASRSQQDSEKAPGSVSIFTREELLLMGVTDLNDLLNHIPGLHSTSGVWQGKYGRYSVRGISHQSGVLFLVDGERLNSLYSGGTSFANVFPLENIARIEILRGPGSAMWGTNALLAVVNIVTVKGRDTVSLGLGDTRRIILGGNQIVQVTPDLVMDLYAAYEDDEGYEFDNVLDRTGNRVSTQDGVRMLTGALSLRYGNIEAHVRHATRSDIRGFAPWGTHDRWNNMTSSVTTARLSHSREFLQGMLEIRSALALRRDLIDGGGRELHPDEDDGLPEPLRSMYDIEMVEVRPSVNTAWKLLEGNELNVGAEFHYLFVPRTIEYANVDWTTGDHLGDIMERAGDESTIDPDAVRTNLGVYLEDSHRFSDWLVMTGGVRLDVANDYSNAISPRLAAVFTAPMGGWAKALYGRAFRAPNLREAYVDVPGIIVGNQDLKPESLDTFELSLGGSLKNAEDRRWLNASATGFLVQTKDLMALEADDAGTFRFTNFGEERSYGVEVEVQAEPLKKLNMRASYTHIFEYERDGEKMGDAIEQPKDSASAIINYRLDDVAIHVNGMFRSAPGALVSQDAYFIAGMALHYFWTPFLRTSLVIDNMTDEVYYGPSERPNNLPEGVPHRGRTILFGLRYGE